MVSVCWGLVLLRATWQCHRDPKPGPAAQGWPLATLMLSLATCLRFKLNLLPAPLLFVFCVTQTGAGRAR